MDGPGRELVVEADRRNMQTVLDFVAKELEAVPGCSRKDVLLFHMVIDEIFGNIADYAYVDDKKGTVRVTFDYGETEGAALLTFEDDGRFFDPLAKEDPDVTVPADKRMIGGLGIFMVKKAMDEVSYENKGGLNILRMKKKIGGENA